MVLIVEPSKQLSSVIGQAFKKVNIQPAETHSSEQAILAADNKDLEAVVIELLMPKHNGLEFIYEFRSYADWFDIPVIIYSQLSREELGLNSALMSDLGIYSHLYKPTTSLDKLVGEVQRVITK